MNSSASLIKSQKLAPTALQCPKCSAQRSAVVGSFYLSVSEVIDDFSIFAILKYIKSSIIYLPKFICLRLSKLNVTANSDVNF